MCPRRYHAARPQSGAERLRRGLALRLRWFRDQLAQQQAYAEQQRLALF
jgi:hypothetical protein